MRARMFALAVFAALTAQLVYAHGPQIQITNDNNKIATRQLHLDGPYSDALTAPKSVYVMPVFEFSGVWYSRPNNEIDPILLQPAFPSGPGLAYGYDLRGRRAAGVRRWQRPVRRFPGRTEALERRRHLPTRGRLS